MAVALGAGAPISAGTARVDDGIAGDRPGMQPGPMAARIGIVHQPGVAGYVLLEHEDVAAPGRHHLGRRDGPREAQPVSRKVQGWDDPAEQMKARHAAAEPAGTSRRSTANYPRYSSAGDVGDPLPNHRHPDRAHAVQEAVGLPHRALARHDGEALRRELRRLVALAGFGRGGDERAQQSCREKADKHGFSCGDTSGVGGQCFTKTMMTPIIAPIEARLEIIWKRIAALAPTPCDTPLDVERVCSILSRRTAIDLVRSSAAISAF